MKKKILPIAIVILIVVGGGAFYGGMKYGENNPPAGGSAGLSQGNFQNFRGQGGGTGTGIQNGNRGGGLVNGQIIAKDDKSITIQLSNNGGSKIVFYSGTTQIGNFTTGTSKDLEIGKTVMVNGQANSDGSISGQSIQIRPIPTSQ